VTNRPSTRSGRSWSCPWRPASGRGQPAGAGPAQAKRLEVPTPILSNADLETIRHVTQRQFPAVTISTTSTRRRGEALEEGLERICRLASEKIREGYTVLVLSDRHVDATTPHSRAARHRRRSHHLVREHTRAEWGWSSRRVRLAR